MGGNTSRARNLGGWNVWYKATSLALSIPEQYAGGRNRLSLFGKPSALSPVYILAGFM